MIEINADSLKQYEENMDKSLSVLLGNLNSIRAGRANPKILDKLTINYYDVETPLNQVANIQIPEARILMISPWDPKCLGEIERAINMSDIGINPNNDGKSIRLVFPMLTEERRKDLVKLVSKYGEETKIAIRNIRREAMDKFKGYNKKKELTDDVLSEVETMIQKLTDKKVAEVESTLEKKNKELMEI